jgi:RNA-directed DNA polymerase
MNPTGGARNGHGTRAEKESRCENPTLDKALERENLVLAWKRVRANKGAPGVDEMSIEEFPRLIREHWDSILARLKAGTYQPSPVKRVEIPKPDGTKRALGIPTVLDRVIQQAIAQVLTPFYDPGFSEHSHGFRPGRSAHGAIRELQRESNVRRKGWAVDCDLKSFFDTVDHHHLTKRLRARIADQQLLDLIGRYLKAGVILLDGTLEASSSGVPQGGPLSPLLANILLDELDRELEARGHGFCRYADDFIILCRSPRAGLRIMQSVKSFVQNRLKLIVNAAKSKVVEISKATFLGFQLVRKKIRWSEKSMERFKARIREITHRTRGVSPVRVIKELAIYIRGALNYYEPGVQFNEARNLDQWLRRRMRLYYWKQWGRPRTRRRRLLNLGIGREEVHKASRSRKGPWRMSHNSIVQRAITNQWLSDQGVPSIEKQWVSIRYPDGPKPGKLRAT